MPVYAIGDIQGCCDELQLLLEKIAFDRDRDTLWFTGDLVNRGPRSADVLRFVRDLGGSAVTVLGNHDLHTLAVTEGHLKYHKKDTIDDILNASDREELMDWLRHLPLLHHDSDSGFTLIHAGLPPQWGLAEAQARAAEVEATLRGPDYVEYLDQMYGNKPRRWKDSLTGWERMRFITNCFTRLRYCDAAGRLALEEKGPPGSQPADYQPWFKVPERASAKMKIVFGHWSTLGAVEDPNVFPLDTGCLWGGSLTAMRLDTLEHTTIACPEAQIPTLKKKAH